MDIGPFRLLTTLIFYDLMPELVIPISETKLLWFFFCVYRCMLEGVGGVFKEELVYPPLGISA